MSWIAIGTGTEALRLPRTDAGHPELLTAGTLVVECAFRAEPGTPQVVLSMDRTRGWHRRFSLVFDAAGVVRAEYAQGSTLTRAEVRIDRPASEAALRLTLTWSAPERIGVFSVQNLDTGEWFQDLVHEPQPWLADDVTALVRPSDERQADPALAMIACADRVEPVGLPTGLCTGTLIDTPTGPQPVETLRPGDLVQTSEHGMQPLRLTASQTVPALGRFAPVVLRVPFFGLAQDLTVAPDHRLLIQGADAEYLFGSDSVLVEARHLARMAPTRPPARTETVRYVHLVLDAHVCLAANGGWAESLYLGDLAEQPLLRATSPFAALDPLSIPLHDRTANLPLRGYEAMVLVSAMCA